MRVKNRKRKLVFLITLCIALSVIIIGSVAFMLIGLKYNYNDITGNPEDLGFEGVIDKNVVNVALFGVDSRTVTTDANYKGNSDTMMVMSINKKTKKIKLISLMRDSLVPIERENETTYFKMNAAYSWGGPELAIKTINKNFGLDISEYATINFYGLADIIDAVGGVDIELTYQEITITGRNNHGINDYIKEICKHKKIDYNKYRVTEYGKQHLNGIQAVAYSRMRYCRNIFGTNDDYGRTDRQRYVMEQLFNKVKNLKKSAYIKLMNATLPYLETSLSKSQIMGIGVKFLLSRPTFEQYRIPQNSSKMNFLMPSPKGRFGSVVYYDLNYASKVIKGIIYDDMTLEEFVAQNPIEKNDWYRQQ